MILVAILVFSACSNPSDSVLNDEDSSGSRTISVSVASGNGSSAGVGARVYQIEEIIDDSFYKDSRKDTNRGSLKATLSPESFILDLDGLDIYQNLGGGTYKTEELAPTLSQPGGGIIPRHVNIMYANDFIRDFSIDEDSWDGLFLKFLPHASGDSNDGHYVRSMLGVDLGSTYNGIVLPDEVAGADLIDADPNLHYFSFSNLQPYSTGFLGYLLIGDDITTEGIQNPGGVDGSWDLPGGGTNGNSSQIFIPGPAIDFTPYINPEIKFLWNTVDLIQIYEGPTTSDDDDIVTFNLSDPFPVSLIVQENDNSQSDSNPNDSTAPAEVSTLAISGATTWNTIQWINPIDPDFKEVLIVRKAGSAPASRNDGEVVYEGYEPNWCDSEGASGTNYYYSVYTVDYSGNTSNGKTVNQVQN